MVRFAYAWSILLLPSLCGAQDAPAASTDAAKPAITFTKTLSPAQAAAQEEANSRAFYDYPLGRTFWYKPSKTASPVKFYQRL